jgi:hypothetical protein
MLTQSVAFTKVKHKHGANILGSSLPWTRHGFSLQLRTIISSGWESTMVPSFFFSIF